VEIWEFVSSQNREAAGRLVRDITEKFETLWVFPETGRMRDELITGLRSFPVGKYVVFYFIIKDGIQIARVLHSAQDIETIIAGD
jgi:toxin ParE1/3/4